MEETKEYRAALKRARRALDQAAELAGQFEADAGDEREKWEARARRWRISSEYIQRSLTDMRR